MTLKPQLKKLLVTAGVIIALPLIFLGAYFYGIPFLLGKPGESRAVFWEKDICYDGGGWWDDELGKCVHENSEPLASPSPSASLK